MCVYWYDIILGIRVSGRRLIGKEESDSKGSGLLKGRDGHNSDFEQPC